MIPEESAEGAEHTRSPLPISPPGNQFPQWIRIQKRPDFLRVYDGGRKSARRFLVVHCLERPEPELPTRLGITISKKCGKSHDRNLARRRIREIFRRLHSQLLPGYDLVVNGRSAVAKAPYEALAKEFRGCLKELKLLPPSAPKPQESPSPLEP
ncbi:MAG: ribonuclease P protein component [Candidatus Sumerlaeia bacterium]|nr:ribonuclease P protein component [Candidatus Sumerlaeia bacterium]